MADVRLTVVVLAACSAADAQPSQSMKPPPGWQGQPAIANAAKQALGKATIDSLEAIGEPSIGCYAVSFGLRSSGNAKDLAEQLLRGLGDKKLKRPLTVKDVVKPTTDEGVFALVFESAPYKGRFRARLGKGRITAMACFSSQREPAACDTACTTLLGAIQ